MIEPTAKEAAIIKELKSLARHWPKSLWLYSANGTLCVMRAGPNGEKKQVGCDDDIDPAGLITTIKIPKDGGD